MNGSTDSHSSSSHGTCNVCRKVSTKKEEPLRARCSSTGPSAFIPEDEILEALPMDPCTELLLVEAYSPCTGLDHLTQVMGLHPQYLQSFLQNHFYLLWMDGPLPLHYRQYIAIMAVARHQCSFLVEVHVQEFCRVGGPTLAHHQGPHPESGEDRESSWSLTELVHAVVLLAHFHALASFVLGSGINPEEEEEEEEERDDQRFGSCSCDLADSCSLKPEEVFCGSPEMTDSVSELEALMDRMKRLQEEQEEEEASQEEMATRFEREKKESLLVGSGDFKEEVVTKSKGSQFVVDSTFRYQDFARHGEDDLPTFRAQDYSWEDHGFSLVNRLYSDIGILLDDKFRTVCNLTYYNMATHEDVDTTTLRRAIFNYVHCMYGIRYDDYNYGEVNQLLERSLKVYIKTVTCYPERTTCHMYHSYWRQFRHSEKVHVNLLLMEARMQAELLYALRAITHYMT
ncbi:hypothetical protein COCON_G00084350 [Conger conger]|uniref:Uncharacterized protein n=1 Tax=Conger conger TaxID=82655 RepID=A0A9Q1I2W0_CONCO|nr:hypothetical protein COCON_G00084350 [Conger conger]